MLNIQSVGKQTENAVMLLMISNLHRLKIYLYQFTQETDALSPEYIMNKAIIPYKRATQEISA